MKRLGRDRAVPEAMPDSLWSALFSELGQNPACVFAIGQSWDMT